MLATSARVVPHIIRDCRAVPRGLTVTLPPSTVASTNSVSSSLSWPSLPLADKVEPTIPTSTPAGMSTGYFPTRDISSPHLSMIVGGGLAGDVNHAIEHHQNTRQRTSPPTLAARASASLITPRGVDRMDTPRPA